MRFDRPPEVSHNACSSHSGHHFEPTALPSGDQPSDPPFKCSGNFENPLPVAQPGVECSQRIFPGDHASKQSPVWSNGEVLDLISVCGEKVVQSQLNSSHRNYNIFRQISRDMMERDHDWDALQCRVQVKEVRNVFCKAREANSHSSAAPTTCRFYKELDVTLGGDLTSTPSTTMDTSEYSPTRQEEEEQSGSEHAEEEEDTPASLDACSQELFSSQEEGSQLRRLVLGEGQTLEEVPDATLRSQLSM
nr:uncharacterized protein LOC125631810 [Caretta caretta]